MHTIFAAEACTDVECTDAMSGGQFAGCVQDLLHARANYHESMEHLRNAQSNLEQFVGDGEARELMLYGLMHRVSNVDGSIAISREGEACH